MTALQETVSSRVLLILKEDLRQALVNHVSCTSTVNF